MNRAPNLLGVPKASGMSSSFFGATASQRLMERPARTMFDS
jgi:hypothetical protein